MSKERELTRAVVNVSTTPYLQRGQARLQAGLDQFGAGCDFLSLAKEPVDSPKHADVPFAFKAFALWPWRDKYDSLIWCDSCILPVRSMEPAWRHIEEHGALFMNNGFDNVTWTADSAYPDLFPNLKAQMGDSIHFLSEARLTNRNIPHTVGGFFGLSMRHEVGRAALEEFYRLAKTRAFCGPGCNSNRAQPGNQPEEHNAHCGPCGPPDVRGHRHDQTALSVIAWRLDIKLVDAPQFFIYGKAEDAQDERTVAVADGSYA